MPMFLKVKLCNQFKYVYVCVSPSSYFTDWTLTARVFWPKDQIAGTYVQKGKLHEVT